MRHPKTRIATSALGSLLILCALGASNGAHAAEPDSERARALFDEAGELERHGQWGAAQERLRAALRLRETPQLYYALGWALENDDKLLEAKAEYETAVRLGREKPTGEEAARLASARLAELDKKMPIIKVRVVGGAKGNTRVLVDGREIKRDDDVATTPVNPGSHVVRVERGSSDAVEQMVYVGRSTMRTVDFDAGGSGSENVASRDTTQDRHAKAVAPITMTSQRDATKGSSNTVLPWLMLSGGVAFIAGGAALLLSADSDADTRDANQAKWCTATACSGAAATRPETPEAAAFREEASNAASSGNTKQALGFALGGVGLVSATVGAILLLKVDDHGAKEAAPPTARSRARASAAPIPGGAFATAGFSF